MMESSLFTIKCVVPACLSVTAVAFNAVAILALRRTLALPKNSKLLLLSMAVSDVGVGLLVQPLYVAEIVVSHTDLIRVSYFMVTNFLCAASLIGVTALAADRFLAIHLHLRYHEFVTYKRVVFVVILIWISSAVIGLLPLWKPSVYVSFAFVPIVTIVGLVVIAIFNLKIYLAVKYHTEQIAAMQVSGGGEIKEEMQRNLEKQKNAAVAIFYVYVVLVVCYLPNLILVFRALAHSGKKLLTTSEYLTAFSDLLVFLNSSLNPLIYCWKMKHIRHAVRNILVNIFSCLS